MNSQEHENVQESYVSFYDLSSIGNESDNFVFRIRPPSTIDLNNTITINFSGTLIFDSQTEYVCKLIKVQAGMNVTFLDLNLKGGINTLPGSFITIKNSRIHEIQFGVDYLLASTSSTLEIENTIFENSLLYGISADESSNITLRNCKILNCTEAGLVATGYSRAFIYDCVIDSSQTDLTIADTHSHLVFSNTEFKNAQQTAIFINDNSTLKVTNSKFTDNHKGALTVRMSLETELIDCDIINSGDTCILLDSAQTILNNVYMRKCNGNFLNASSHSAAFIRDCHFEESQWPLLAFCDGAMGYVSHCIFEKSLMSGVIVRSSNRVVIEDCIIRTCAEAGTRVINSKNITIRNCCIGDTQYGALEVCDLSDVNVEDCIIAGGAAHGINVFTGAVLHITRTQLIGPFNSFMWIHHGASIFASEIVFADSPSPIKKGQWRLFANCAMALAKNDIGNPIINETYSYNFDEIKSDEINLELPKKQRENDIKICRIDTKYAVEVINSYIVGVGNYELHANNLAKMQNKNFILKRCFKCNKVKSCCLFSPCGHAIYCPECWDELPENDKPTKCPLCHLPIEKTLHQIFNQGADEHLCPICYTNNIDSVIMPCGHPICLECCTNWFVEHTECPFCREEQARFRPFVPYE